MNTRFDGDTLNILMIYNKEFNDACNKIYNPRNAFCISRNDGKMNSQINVFKDILINLDALLDISRDYYTPQQLAQIQQAKSFKD